MCDCNQTKKTRVRVEYNMGGGGRLSTAIVEEQRRGKL